VKTIRWRTTNVAGMEIHEVVGSQTEIVVDRVAFTVTIGGRRVAVDLRHLPSMVARTRAAKKRVEDILAGRRVA
jgi:hypothetical protein